MVSLVIYVIAFVIIMGIVGTITIFFSNQARDVNRTAGTSSEYNKFNLYMLDQTKGGYKISKMSEETAEEQFVTFSKDTDKNIFVLKGNILYFNEVKLCENIEEFKLSKETASNGKEVLKTYLNVNGTVYTTDYVIE